MPEFRQIDVGALSLKVALEGEGPLVVMVHGFPESWYSWRHQIGPVAAAGYKVAAIDVRGYGGSDKPQDIAAYAMEAIVGDVVGLKQVLQPDAPAILVGHDWGAPIVWNSAFTRPDLFRAVAGLSVPFTGVPQRPFTQVFRELFTAKGLFFYQEYFQEPGRAEAELEADVRRSLRLFLTSASGDAPASAWAPKPADSNLLDSLPEPERLPDWLSEADLDFYTAEFTASGFRGPLNRYRNHEADYAWLSQFAGRTLDQPALYIGGTRDPASTLFGQVADPVAMMRRFAPHVVGHMLEGCGHWTQQERPEEVNRLLLDWLAGLP
ncbi:alpha/beta fold hydrolase [Novosphingobium nitrogenifigens]|uniref:alpha/beta fold hydrolase n=1 Tax=Novosphingobium nitrogenifigens TaxID=378548 RepID=UPI0002E1477A|nr:alpha/beta hydrolase [Novosphingobium nitrogenifigens]